MTIVKVQRPLAGTYDGPAENAYLVYAQGRRHLATQPVPKHVIDVLRSRIDGKSYFEATWNAEAKQWVIGDKTEWQEW